jgi:hypothetical protein
MSKAVIALRLVVPELLLTVNPSPVELFLIKSGEYLVARSPEGVQEIQQKVCCRNLDNQWTCWRRQYQPFLPPWLSCS